MLVLLVTLSALITGLVYPIMVYDQLQSEAEVLRGEGNQLKSDFAEGCCCFHRPDRPPHQCHAAQAVSSVNDREVRQSLIEVSYRRPAPHRN